uniref:DUF342 domain-containing protein n=1 Tax=Agathobacter sp. TaxID=2021311 RepID=UPI00405757CA
MENTTLNIKPRVRIAFDEMEAFLTLPAPMMVTDTYEISEVIKEVELAGVRFGFKREKVEQMIADKCYNLECKIAEGIPAVNGVDGFYDFKFDTQLNRKPQTKDDGTVDYWSVHAIEVVKAGQVIAVYNEPIEGSNGMTVKGKMLPCKKGRPLPALTGRGFERDADNKTYIASIDGKIDLQKTRVMISAVYEVQGDVGLKTGNIDFRGDVIIHGNVPTGAVVKATGSITIDGTVEGSIIIANKDIIIRGGMLGAGKGLITTKGSLNVKFIEHAEVKAEGPVTTDTAIDCHIVSNDRVIMKGKRASIIGGVTSAAKGIEAYNLGNVYGIKTEVYTGVNMEVKQQLVNVEKNIEEAEDMINKINIGIKQMDDVAAETGQDLRNDPRRASLLRTKILKQADLAAYKQQLSQLQPLLECAHGASVRVLHAAHPGVVIGINDSVLNVDEERESVAFVERDAKIVMYSLKGELV